MACTSRGNYLDTQRRAGVVADNLTLRDVKTLGTQDVATATKRVGDILGLQDVGLARQVAKSAHSTFACLSH